MDVLRIAKDDNQNIRHSSKGKSTSLFSYTSSKSDVQTNARMLHGILVFYVSSPHFEHHKIHVQNLVCPNSCFSPKNARRKGFVEISTKP